MRVGVSAHNSRAGRAKSKGSTVLHAASASYDGTYQQVIMKNSRTSRPGRLRYYTETACYAWQSPCVPHPHDRPEGRSAGWSSVKRITHMIKINPKCTQNCAVNACDTDHDASAVQNNGSRAQRSTGSHRTAHSSHTPICT